MTENVMCSTEVKSRRILGSAAQEIGEMRTQIYQLHQQQSKSKSRHAGRVRRRSQYTSRNLKADARVKLLLLSVIRYWWQKFKKVLYIQMIRPVGKRVAMIHRVRPRKA